VNDVDIMKEPLTPAKTLTVTLSAAVDLHQQCNPAATLNHTPDDPLLNSFSRTRSVNSAITLSTTQDTNDAPVVAVGLDCEPEHPSKHDEDEITRIQSPPPRYPASEPSSSAPPSPRPPPFSSLYASTAEVFEAYKTAVTEAGTSGSVPAYAPVAPELYQPSASSRDVVAETKAALPQDTKGESSKKDEDSEPPPAYSEGSSPLESFTYLMAAAGGAASIITQVQQGGAPPINTLGG